MQEPVINKPLSVGGVEGEGAAEGEGDGPAVQGSAVRAAGIPEAGTPRKRASWNKDIFYFTFHLFVCNNCVFPFD